jgi:hypothetical protein
MVDAHIRLQMVNFRELNESLYYTTTRQPSATCSIDKDKRLLHTEGSPPDTDSISPTAHPFEDDKMSSSSVYQIAERVLSKRKFCHDLTQYL